MTYQELKNNQDIRTYIKQADESLMALGYSEHSFSHVTMVAVRTEEILTALGYSQRMIELAKIAGLLHDIGNLINREEHSQSGAVIAFRLLDKLGFPPEEIALVVTAIGNHDEGNGVPVSDLAAALILADKSDVRRSRVRNHDFATFDIHDRVNYAVTESSLSIDKEQKTITLTLSIDTKISAIMDYFEIFMARMLLCRKAADRLKLQFKLNINDQQLL